MLGIANDAWQTGGAIAAVVVVAQGAFALSKYAIASRRNGSASAGQSPCSPTVHSNAEVLRKHEGRIASVETSLTTLKEGQKTLFRKMDCIDNKLTRVLTENDARRSGGD